MSTLSWQTYEFEKQEKTIDWFWGAGIIGASLAVISVIFGNIIFAVLIAVATFALIVLGNKDPHLLECEINTKGIKVNETFYPFKHLDSFNIPEGSRQKLVIKSSKLVMPIITIPFEGIHPDDIASLLTKKIRHDENLHEPFAHVFLDYLGF